MKTATKRGSDKLNEDVSELREVLTTISHYKQSILLTLSLTLLLVLFFLYFKTPVYRSSAIIEVKSGTKQGTQTGDVLGSTFSNIDNEKVDKEIEILKTFYVNNYALNKVNFQTRYFVNKGLKKVEIYENIPIEVKNVTILDNDFRGCLIKFFPLEDGYQLQIQNSFTKKLFDKNIIELDDDKVYHYGEDIKTKYFEFTIEEKGRMDEPLYFVIKGNNRQIYQEITSSKKLQIMQLSKDTPLIQVTFKDTIPKRANSYVNALIESFIFQSVEEKTKKNNRILDFIETQLSEMKTTLDNSEKKLEQYRIKNKAINPTLQAQTYITELSNIEIELSKNSLNDILIQNLLLYAEKGKDLDAMAPSLMQLNDQPTLELISKLQEAQIEEEGLRTQYSDKHPGLRAVRKQIQFIKKKIKINIKNLQSSMAHKNTNLLKLKRSYEKNLESLPTQERKLINLKRDYEVSSATYNYLLTKKSENEMIKVAILSDYRIIDRAYNNGKPISPKSALIILLGLILGLILGFSQAFLRNKLNDKIQAKEDIESRTTLPIYGILPTVRQRLVKLEVFKDPKSHFAESYRSLRTNLQFGQKENEANVILVTSTIAGEGKSTIVANLGAVFQMANYRSIMINLDLRKPTLHHYFDVDNSVGMSTYLSGRSKIGEIIQSTDFSNLDIISSGPVPPNPSELILSDRLEELVDTLKESYDYIFIDSAPLGLVTDTMQLMQYADISLVVFRENYAKKSFVSDLNNLVKSHDLKNMGIVINSVDSSSGSYGYGYGYGNDDK